MSYLLDENSAGGFVSPQSGGISPQGFADGGPPQAGEMGSWYTRRQATDNVHSGGLFKSAVPGRTDKLDTLVPGGAYVVPADVVSGLGQGNTMAGSAVLDKMFSTAPFGGRLPHGGRGGAGIPGAPGPFRQHRAAGGKTSSHVPIVAAGGEYLIPPEVVALIGGGDITRGHKILDHFVVHARKKTTDEMRKLPGPKK